MTAPALKFPITTNKLSNLQVELLKVFAFDLTEEQLLEVRSLLARYFAEKASDRMDLLWDQNNWSAETMKSWGEEHLRTSQNG